MTATNVTAETPWQRLGNRFTLGLRSRDEAEWLREPDAFADAGRRVDQIAETAWLLDNHDEVFAAFPHLDAGAVLDMVAPHWTTTAGHRPDGPMHLLEMRHEWCWRISCCWHRGGAGDATLDCVGRGVRPFRRIGACRKNGPSSCRHPRAGPALRRAARAANGQVLQQHEGRAGEPPLELVGCHDKQAVHPAPHAPDTAGAGGRYRRDLPSHGKPDASQTGQTGHVLFTIRTYVEPLSRWAGIPGALGSLAEMLAGMTPQMRDYKGVELYEDALKTHLAADRARVS